MENAISGIGFGLKSERGSIQFSGRFVGDVLNVEALSPSGEFEWRLPPSKSHTIRFLALAAQGESECRLRFEGVLGADVESMARCLEAMGVEIERETGSWLVRPPEAGLRAPEGVLDCGNSGATARILTVMAANLEVPVTIDGDESLRRRSSPGLAKVLRELGCQVSSDGLPCEVCGPVSGGSAVLDVSASSQPLTALVLASPGFAGAVELVLEGEAVSRGYGAMSFDIAARCGSPNRIAEPLSLVPWRVEVPEVVDIPPELSLFPLAILLEIIHDDLRLNTTLPTYDPLMLIAIDAIDRADGGEVDLSDASDLVTPAAAWLALTSGGTLTGIAHARGKESNRIAGTIEMLATFGLEAQESADGMVIKGGQSLHRPIETIETHMDHRLAMTAMVLASKVGGVIVGAEISEVTHPGFVKQLLALGTNQ